MAKSFHSKVGSSNRSSRIARLGLLIGCFAAWQVIPAAPSKAQPIESPAKQLAATDTTASDSTRDGAKDFDFLIGKWTTKNRRMLRPLTGDTAWETFDSLLTVQALPGGFGNVDLFEPIGWRPGFLGLSLRLYNPQTRRWSIFWLNNGTAGMVGDTGQLDTPVVGSFRNGVGTLESREVWDGKPIRVRYVWFDITPRSVRWRQEFSADDGKTWEVNWVAEHTRVGA